LHERVSGPPREPDKQAMVKPSDVKCSRVHQRSPGGLFFVIGCTQGSANSRPLPAVAAVGQRWMWKARSERHTSPMLQKNASALVIRGALPFDVVIT